MFGRSFRRTNINFFKSIKSLNAKRFSVSCSNLASFKVSEHHFVRDYNDSFQLWILHLFKHEAKYSFLEFKEPHKIALAKNVIFDNLTVEELLNLLHAKKTKEELTPQLLRQIEKAISLKLSSCSSSDLLKILGAYMLTVPIQATKSFVFQSALVHLGYKINGSGLSPHNIIQSMYYASHLKSNVITKKFMWQALHNLTVDDLATVDVRDLGILCVSMFRSSVPVQIQPILLVLVDRLKSEIDSLIIKQPAIFVSFIKCFRISKHYDYHLLDFIALQGLRKLSQLDIVGKIHLGVYFAAALYCNVTFVSEYLISCIRELSENIASSKTPRLKDINNLLWTCGVFNLKEVNAEIMNSGIINYVIDSMCILRRDPQTQLSLLLWLWICECRLEREIEKYLTSENIERIKGSKNFKDIANLFLLLTCVQIEAPALLKPQIINSRDTHLQPKFGQYIKRRPALNKLFVVLNTHGSALKLKNVRFAFEIPALYIGGISADYQGNSISFEVMDSEVCLADNISLVGKMKLKLRLLEKMGKTVLQVPGMSSYELEDIRQRLLECYVPND